MLKLSLALALIFLSSCSIPKEPTPFEREARDIIYTYNNILTVCYDILLEKREWKCGSVSSPLIVSLSPTPPKSPLERITPVFSVVKDIGEALGPLVYPALVGKVIVD